MAMQINRFTYAEYTRLLNEAEGDLTSLVRFYRHTYKNILKLIKEAVLSQNKGDIHHYNSILKQIDNIFIKLDINTKKTDKRNYRKAIWSREVTRVFKFTLSCSYCIFSCR